MGSAAGLCERHQKLSLCQTEPVPVSSKMELLLPKAEPLSHAGDASAIRYLGNGTEHCTEAERVRITERNNPADPKVIQKGHIGSAPGTQRFPYSPPQ